LVIWSVLMVLSGLGVWSVHALGPRILLRDETGSSWHFLEKARKIMKESGARFGKPGYLEALKKAEPYLRKAADLSPRRGEYRIELARNLFNQGRIREAYIEGIRGFPRCDPTDGKIAGFLGEMAVKLEKWEEAEGYLRRAVRYEPQSRFHRERLAKTLLKEGKIDEGIEVFRKRFEDLPSLTWSRINAGYEAAKVKRWKEAVEWLTLPSEEDRVGGRMWMVLAVAHAALGDIDEAAEAIAQNTRLMKEKPPTLPDLSYIGLPPLDPEITRRLEKAYQLAYHAAWEE